jgi:hypothetical protein
MIATGIFVGCLIPLTTYPRLGISAHIHFLLEGVMILGSGLILHLAPITIQPQSSYYQTPQNKNKPRAQRLVDTLSPWQTRLIYWAFAFSWPLLIAEVFNAWWGTSGTLPTAAKLAGVRGKAFWWQEAIMVVTHYGSALPQVLVVGFILLGELVWGILLMSKVVADHCVQIIRRV